MAAYLDGLRTLLIGSGGREHALGWKLSKAPSVEHVYVLPGNGGTEQGPKMSNVTDGREMAKDDYAYMVRVAKDLEIHLVVVGPDSPVVDGIQAYFEAGMNETSPLSLRRCEIDGGGLTFIQPGFHVSRRPRWPPESKGQKLSPRTLWENTRSRRQPTETLISVFSRTCQWPKSMCEPLLIMWSSRQAD
jgi:hypothetical protein